MAIPVIARPYPCLPPDITEDTVVSYRTLTSPKGKSSVEPITVGQTLRKLQAKCTSSGRLLRGRTPVRFYLLQNCWGNPPEDYLEILAQQKREIARLKKKNIVIEIACNASGTPLRSVSKVCNSFFHSMRWHEIGVRER